MLEKNEECKCNASAICTRKTRGQRADFYWFARLIPSEISQEMDAYAWSLWPSKRLTIIAQHLSVLGLQNEF